MVKAFPMRIATLLAFVLLAGLAVCVPVLAQVTGFTLAEYNAPQYAAPDDAPSSVVIAGKDEPGDRLVVTGRTLDGERPVAGVSLYVFHTDAKGLYAGGFFNGPRAEFNPRLHGSLRTDAQGRYQYETIRPGSYGNPLGASHVHYVVKAPGYQPLLLALQFEDDPIVVRARQAGTTLLNSDAFKNGPCKSRPDCVLTQPVTRDAQGVSHVTRDIQMVKE
jgi:protocatechuate 3,4-dioxygenase beta subunit